MNQAPNYYEHFDVFNETYESTQQSSQAFKVLNCLPELKVYPPQIDFSPINIKGTITIVNDGSHPIKINRIEATPGYAVVYELPEYLRAHSSIQVEVIIEGDITEDGSGYLLLFLDQNKGMFAANLVTKVVE